VITPDSFLISALAMIGFMAIGGLFFQGIVWCLEGMGIVFYEET